MTKRSFLIIHGLGGSGADHWQTWLYKELKKRNYPVSYPAFSNKNNPDKDEWLLELDTAIHSLPKDHPLTVITHSLGCLLWLHYSDSAGQYKQIADQVILVAPPSPKSVIPEAKTFYPVPLKNANLTRTAMDTLFVHSTNDHYCCKADAEEFAKLGAQALTLQNAGHINAESGYGKWQWILDSCIKEKSLV